MEAVKSGNLGNVKSLVEGGLFPLVRDKHRNTLLHLCCISEHCQLDMLQYLLENVSQQTRSTLRYLRNINGSLLLHLACASGKETFVKFLVPQYFKFEDFVIPDYQHETSLYLACKCGHFSIVSYALTHHNYLSSSGICQCILVSTIWQIMLLLFKLINFNDFITESQQRDHTHLVLAIPITNDNIEFKCRTTTCLHLIAALNDVHSIYLHSGFNWDINCRDSDLNTPLHIAVQYNCTSVAKYFINAPECDVEVKNKFNDRPLHLACESGNIDIVRHLVVDKHCDINVKDFIGYTPLHRACEKGHFEIVKFLTDQPQCNIDAESDVIIKDRSLHLACKSGNIDIVRHLVVDKHYDINVKDSIGYTPLHRACEKGHFEIVKFLTDQPQCNIDAESDVIIKRRPLHLACESGNIDIVRHLVVDKHCDINVKDSIGYTQLHRACEEGHFEIVKFLTDQPQCNIDAESNLEYRPLHLACKSGNIDIVRHLVVDKHCDINVKDIIGYTPLHSACKNGDFKIVKFLTDQPQCNIDAADVLKHRPLHLACKSGNIDIVRHLVVDKHCDINVKDIIGYTPLHSACKNGDFKIVKFLTDQPQCNIDAADVLKHRPLYLACESGNIDIVHHLVFIKQCFTNINDMKRVAKLASSSLKNIIHFASLQLPEHKLQFLTPNGIYFKYQLALQSEGIASLKVVKCILTGPPGAGKSTLKKKLLNESLTEPSFSTGVADAAVQVNYRKLEQCNAQALITTELKKQGPGEEAVLFLDKIASKRTDHVNAVSTCQTDQPSDIHTDSNKTVGYNSDSEEFIQESEGIQENKTSFDVNCHFNEINSCDIEEPNQSEPTDENNMDSSTQENETSLSAELHKKKGIDALSNFVTKNISNKKRKEYEKKILQDNDHAMIHIIDTGGQPEFHEMLPALITGPAINLLVFKLTEDLRSRYKVTYRSSSGDSEPYLTSLTHEEVIFRSLASIACLRQNTIGWSFDKLPIKDDSEPAAFLIATHKDKVDESKVNEVNHQLKTKIQSSPELFHDKLVQFSSQDSVIFALDTRNDDQMIDKLRCILHRVISEKFYELQIPASWCAFSVELKKSKRPLFTYHTCYKLAQECGIKDRSDFDLVLWYLHHRVGSIMYYPEVKDLEDIIITDLQLVFDRITELIRSCFTFKALQDPSVDYEFYKNGRFSESDLTKISSKEKKNSFTQKRLVSLLKHLYIVAGPMKTKVGRKTVNYYFMPCALKPTQVENVQQSASCPVPLLISFECGYTPVGVFCCLVVYLLSQTSLEWKLQEEEETVHYRNKITFEVGKFYDSVTIISHATFLEVLIHRWKTSKLSTDSLCEQVLSVLHNGLIAVTKSLHYTYKSKHLFGFYCHCSPSLLPHSAVINHCPDTAKCRLSKRKIVLDDGCLSWSKKVI